MYPERYMAKVWLSITWWETGAVFSVWEEEDTFKNDLITILENKQKQTL